MADSIAAQDKGRHFIRNYNRPDYEASIANFDVIQDKNGLIYAANYDGVLIYNGSTWEHLSLGENSIASSLGIDDSNRVFIGSREDFGFITPDSHGKNVYTSLRPKIPDSIKFSGVREILPTKEGVWFLSAQAIFFLDRNEKISVIKAGEKKFKSIFEINDKLLVLQQGKGLLSFKLDSVHAVLDWPQVLSWNSIPLMTPRKNNETLIATSSAGFYVLSEDNLNKLPDKLPNYVLSSGVEVKTGDSTYFAFGTIQGGIAQVDENLNNLSFINKNTGLQSEIVKNLEVDQNLNLWTAMQEGLSHIEVGSPWRYWNENDGFEGTPWEILRHNDILYVGTTKGLYYLHNGKFVQVSGINGKVWALSTLEVNEENVLLAGTENGLFEVNLDKSQPVLNFPVVSKLYTPDANKKEVFVGHLAGISKLYYKNNAFVEEPLLSSSNTTVSSMEVDGSSNLWASLKWTGVYKFSHKKDTLKVDLFDQSNGLNDVNEIKLFKKNKDILFTTNEGIYKYQGTNDGFVKDTSIKDTTINISLISSGREGEYYAAIISKNKKQHLEKLILNKDGTFSREHIPFRRLPEMEIIAIYPESNGVVWIAGSEGLFKYNGNIKKDYTLPFNTLINKVYINDSIIFYGSYIKHIENSSIPALSIEQPDSYKPTLTFEDNNITFEYSATSYEVPEKNQFSYFLTNNDKGWSNWSYETKKEYTNLAPGEYTFHVKSKNIYDTEGKVATYQFTILAPWYRTSWAYGLFSILIGCLVWLITMAYSLRVRMQRKKLRLIVADRTYEVMSQKKEIEKQNTLLKVKNEEISSQKDDIESKNKQLRDSQEEILSINHKLTELNMYLEKKVEKRTSKIKATLKQLQQINMELDTFVYRASHDLKGPISRISGITSLAKLESPDAINLKYFNLIEDTAKDMGVLLSKLAQVHEIINALIDKEEIDIPSLLSEIREEVKFLDKGHSTKYSFELGAIMLYSDKHLVSIIIKNLIENALIFRKTNEEQPHHIQVSTSMVNQIFQLRIRDNGIGIYPDHFTKVFQMFFRGSDKSKGSGLGLYLVKMCIDKLNATIHLESKEAEFTEFTIEIPS